MATVLSDGEPAQRDSERFGMETGIGRILLDEFDGTKSEVYGGSHLTWEIMDYGTAYAHGGCDFQQCKPGTEWKFNVPPLHSGTGGYYSARIACLGCSWRIRIQEFR